MDEPKRNGYEATCYCVDSSGDPHQGCPQCGGEGVVGVKEQTPTIVQALAFRKWAYENNLVGPDGQPRKILGTLPVTADGAVAMPGSVVFCPWFDGWHVRGLVRYESHGPEVVAFVECNTTVDGRFVGIRTLLNECYSTREAAERAAKERSDCERSEQGANDGH